MNNFLNMALKIKFREFNFGPSPSINYCIDNSAYLKFTKTSLAKLIILMSSFLMITSCGKEIDLDQTTPMVVEMVKNIPPKTEQFNLTEIAKKYIPLGSTLQEGASYLDKSGFEIIRQSGSEKLYCQDRKSINQSYFVCSSELRILDSITTIKRIKLSFKVESQKITDIYAVYQGF